MTITSCYSHLYIIKHKPLKTKQNFSTYLNNLAKAIEQIYFLFCGCSSRYIIITNNSFHLSKPEKKHTKKYLVYCFYQLHHFNNTSKTDQRSSLKKVRYSYHMMPKITSINTIFYNQSPVCLYTKKTLSICT